MIWYSLALNLDCRLLTPFLVCAFGRNQRTSYPEGASWYWCLSEMVRILWEVQYRSGNGIVYRTG